VNSLDRLAKRDDPVPMYLRRASSPRVPAFAGCRTRRDGISPPRDVVHVRRRQVLLQMGRRVSDNPTTNAPSYFIANVEDPATFGSALANPVPAREPGGCGHIGPAFWIKVIAQPTAASPWSIRATTSARTMQRGNSMMALRRQQWQVRCRWRQISPSCVTD
jgi:hypothetical protein